MHECNHCHNGVRSRACKNQPGSAVPVTGARQEHHHWHCDRSSQQSVGLLTNMTCHAKPDKRKTIRPRCKGTPLYSCFWPSVYEIRRPRAHGVSANPRTQKRGKWASDRTDGTTNTRRATVGGRRGPPGQESAFSPRAPQEQDNTVLHWAG